MKSLTATDINNPTNNVSFTANDVLLLVMSSVLASFTPGIAAPGLTLTGALLLSSGAVIATPQSLSGAGAVNLTTLSTAFTSNGVGNALTLANGTAGQIKTITHVMDGGTGILTPTTRTGFSTVTFTNAGDSVILQYFTTVGWCVIGSYGVTFA